MSKERIVRLLAADILAAVDLLLASRGEKPLIGDNLIYLDGDVEYVIGDHESLVVEQLTEV